MKTQKTKKLKKWKNILEDLIEFFKSYKTNAENFFDDTKKTVINVKQLNKKDITHIKNTISSIRNNPQLLSRSLCNYLPKSAGNTGGRGW